MFNTTAAPMANNSNHVQQAKEVNKVYKTNNLSMFKQIDGNRIPNIQHVRRLSDSIRVYGMKCNPILVNERMARFNPSSSGISPLSICRHCLSNSRLIITRYFFLYLL